MWIARHPVHDGEPNTEMTGRTHGDTGKAAKARVFSLSRGYSMRNDEHYEEVHLETCL